MTTYRRKRDTRLFSKKLNKVQKTQVKRSVRSLIARNEEKKFLLTDKAFGALPLASNTWVFTDLTRVTQGDADNQRNGDRINVKSLELNMVWSNNGSNKDWCRVIIFQWKPNSTPVAAPGATSIFVAGPTGSADFMSHYGHDTKQLYKILWDKKFCMNDYSVDTNGNMWVNKKITKNFVSALQYLNGGNDGTNHIYITYCVDKPNAAGTPTLQYTARLNFTG